MDAVAETSDEFMERYFNGEEFTFSEIRAAMKFNVCDGTVIPVSMGSSTELRNIHNLMNDIVELFPSPDKKSCNGINMKTNEIFEANYDFSKAKSAYVFKTIVDPFIGKYSLIKVSSGVIKSDDTLYNQDKDAGREAEQAVHHAGQQAHRGPRSCTQAISAPSASWLIPRPAIPCPPRRPRLLFGRTEMSKPYTYMSISGKEQRRRG